MKAVIDKEAVTGLRSVSASIDMAIGILLDHSRDLPSAVRANVITVIDRSFIKLGEMRERLAGQSEGRS